VWAATYMGECICSARDLGSFVLGMISIVAWALAVVPQASAAPPPQRPDPMPVTLTHGASLHVVCTLRENSRRPASPLQRRPPPKARIGGATGACGGVGVSVANGDACLASHGAPQALRPWPQESRNALDSRPGCGRFSGATTEPPRPSETPRVVLAMLHFRGAPVRGVPGLVLALGVDALVALAGCGCATRC
jgi:hypothetical protein